MGPLPTIHSINSRSESEGRAGARTGAEMDQGQRAGHEFSVCETLNFEGAVEAFEMSRGLGLVQ